MHFDPTCLSKLLASRRPGHSLPAQFYLSDEAFDLDFELIFGRHWIFVGVEPEAAEPGDYFTVEMGAASILVVRGDDMQLRAFHNVCRHRGARLLSPGRGDLGQLVCPYHQWTYDLEGQLIHNEHMGEHFERSGHGLRPVHLESLEGLLFVCLAMTPPPGFDEMRAIMQPYLAPHRLRECKVAHQADLVEAGNWKLTMENNRECYHCRANHPQLTVPLHEFGFGHQPGGDNQAKLDAFTALLASEHARWRAAGLPCDEVDRLDATTGFRTVRLPLAHAGESQTLDTRVASRKLLGGFTDARLGGLSFWTQPNSWHHFMSDHIVSFSVLPLGAQRTVVRTRWLVHRDAVEGVDYDVERLIAVWQATNLQDKALVERANDGIGSPAYEPGPFSPYTEGLVEKFCAWYAAAVAAGPRPPTT